MKLPFAFCILRRFTREGIPHLNDKERCMNHSITDNTTIDSIDVDNHRGAADALAASGRTGDFYWDLPRAKPEERPTRGFDMEKILGMCADELDDEFIDEVTANRRGVLSGEGRS
jgi:hypothetical protein